MLGLLKKLLRHNRQTILNSKRIKKNLSLNNLIYISKHRKTLLVTCLSGVFLLSSTPIFGLTESHSVNITATVLEQDRGQYIDTDQDGMPNNWEILFDSDPENPLDALLDPDQDQLTNLQEFNYNTHPRLFDTNEGGITDSTQIADRTNPRYRGNDFQLLPKNEIPKWWKDLYQLDLNKENPLHDIDGDGLSNDLEYQYGTNTQQADTDKDGLWDGTEIFVVKTDPLNKDSDWDNLSDNLEVKTYFTDPLDPDSDQDGVTDGDEILNKTDPLSSASKILLPTIAVYLNEILIPKETNQYKLLVAQHLVITAILNDQQLTTKLELGENTYENFIELPQEDNYHHAVLNFYDEDTLLGKTYLNLNVQNPMQVVKHHQSINLFGIKIYPNSIFYGEMGRVLGLNSIKNVGNASLEISNQVYETDSNGTLVLIMPQNNYILQTSAFKFETDIFQETESVINPIIKLERSYNITGIILGLFLLTILVKRKSIFNLP